MPETPVRKTPVNRVRGGDDLGSQLAVLTNLINRTDSRVNSLSKAVETIANKTPSESVIKSALEGSRNKAFVSGGRAGSGFTDINDLVLGQGWKAKALGNGFGDFLKDMQTLKNPGNLSYEALQPVMKRMGASKATPIEKSSQAEGTGYQGGYLVPPQWGNELLYLAWEDSFLRSQCRNVPMNSRSFYYPVLNQTNPPPNGGSAFFGGIVWQWEPEGANYQTLASTIANFRNIELVARDLVGIVVASNQLLQDSAIALDTILTTLFKESMGWQYDYNILQGSGTNQPLGMLNSPCAISVTRQNAGTFQLLDAANMLSHMVPSSYNTCCWICHPSIYPQLISMQTIGSTSGPLVWLNPYGTGEEGPLARRMPATILGRPLYVTEKLPKLASGALGDVILVDPSKYLVGDRMAIQVEASPYPNFPTNQMTWRIIARWDGQPLLNKPITLADGSFLTSSVVLLSD